MGLPLIDVVADAGGLLRARVGHQLHERSGLVNYHRPLGHGDELRDTMHDAISALASLLVEAEHIDARPAPWSADAAGRS